MTDEQIINNVKCCAKQISNCSQCSYRFNEDDEFDCEEALGRDTLVLINRQKAEIEQWKREAERWQDAFCKVSEDMSTAKSEAIKEFAERLKKDLGFGHFIRAEDIDSLVKEMTE